MKHVKRSFALLMMLCLVLSVAVPAFAADPPKDYCQIRVFGGAQRPGLIKTISVERYTTNFNLGNELAAYLGTDVTGTKYYTRSTVRESGEVEALTSLTIDVEKDKDYVLTYGVKNNLVTYYVQYVDTNGNNIAPAELVPGGQSGPFVANSGDKVYVAYIEIPGYQPDAYNKAKTLTSDYTFVFVYSRTPATTTTTTTTTTTGGGGGGGVAVAGGAAANAAANANANAANNPNANNPAANNPNANTPTDNTNNATQPVTPAAPVELIDEDEVPLAVPNIPGVGTVSVPNAPQVIEPNQHGRIPNWALIAGMVVLVGLIAILYWYLLFYRKKKKYASVNDDYEILGFDNDDDF